MKTHLVRVKWLRTLGNISYVFGIAFLIAAIAVNALPVQIASATNACEEENKDGDNVFCEKIENLNSGDWFAPAGYTITGFLIKAGDETFGPVAGCYEVVQTETSVSWQRIGDGPECKEISHVQIYYTYAPQETTVTPVITETLVVTDTPTQPTPEDKKMKICHAAGQDGTLHYNVLELSVNAVYKEEGGHFYENGDPRAGHEHDFIILTPEDEAKCTDPGTKTPVVTETVVVTDTPTTEPKMQICHIAGGTYNVIWIDWSALAAHLYHGDFIVDGKDGALKCVPPPTDTPIPPTDTPTKEPKLDFDLGFFCTGFTVTNKTSKEIRFEWSIAKGPSDTNQVAGNESKSIIVDYYPGVVVVSIKGVLEKAGYLPTDCESPKTPVATLPVNPKPQITPVIPVTGGGTEILIPVTGAEKNTNLPLNSIFLGLSIGFIGLGLLLNGAARERKDWDV